MKKTIATLLLASSLTLFAQDGDFKKDLNNFLVETRTFHQVVLDGDWKMASLYLKNGAPLSPSLVLAAVKNADLNTLDVLLKHPAPIKIDYNILSAALDTQNEEIMQLLVDKGANLQTLSKIETTLLEDAIYDRDKRRMVLLVKSGAKVDYTHKGFTPLNSAIYHNDFEMVEFLVSLGANVNDKTRSPLKLAIGQENARMVQLLIELGAKIEGSKRPGYTPLQYAIHEDSYSMAELLLKLGASTGSDKYNPSRIAARSGRLAMIELLFEYGTKINETYGSFSSALSGAAGYGQIEAMELLLSLGADINGSSDEAWSPLQHAIHDQQLDAAKLLIERNADLSNGQDLMETAIKTKNIEMIEFLLTTNLKAKRSIIRYAKLEGTDEIVQILKDHFSIVKKIKNVFSNLTSRQSN